jgi:hypothetical protein
MPSCDDARVSEPAPFRMPPLPARLWRDAAGAVIPYGERWGTEGPPEDAFSRVTHPERYAPMHAVADALLAHLLEHYDCMAEDETAGEHELRAVRVRSVPGTAPMRLAWTDFPGVRASLGSAAAAAAPVCGCDACDEPLRASAEQLRDDVLATVSGELREWFSPVRRTEGASFGMHSGWGRSARSRDELRALAKRTPERWVPWPPRGQ